MSKKNDKKIKSQKREVNKISTLILERDITHIVGIDESRNSHPRENPRFVAAVAKLNDYNFCELTNKMCGIPKLRPNRKYEEYYKNLLNEANKNPLTNWFYYCDILMRDSLNKKERMFLTLGYFIKCLGEHFLDLNKTLFLIDGARLKSDRGMTLEGLVDPFEIGTNFLFIVDGDQKLKIIHRADCIAYALCFDRNYKDKFPEKRIDLEAYIKGQMI